MNTPAMSELDQLKDQLKGIISPAPGFELAPGWWFLLILSIAALVLLGAWFAQQYRARAYRRQAIKQLRDFGARPEGIEPEDINGLLKQVAMTTFGRTEIAPLTSQDWVEFLNRTCSSAVFSDHLKYFVAEGIYKADREAAPKQEFLRFAQQWVKQHKRTLPRRSFEDV